MKKRIIYFSFFIFHFSFLNAQSFLWGSYGNGKIVAATSVASDAQGNCYLTGWFDDTIHFGSNTLMNYSVHGIDIFLVKYSHSGNLLWAKQTIDSGLAGLYNTPNISTDRWGNTYVASDFFDTLIIGTYTLVPSKGDDSYVMKYDPGGNIKWIERSTHISSNNEATGDEYSTCDINGNVYLSGSFTDTINFGSYRLIGTSPMYYYNSFLIKFDSNGNVKWVKQSEYTGHNSNDVSYCNANDRFGNSFITGGFIDTVSFGSYSLHGGNNTDFDLVKYDSNGNVLWVKQNTEILGGSSSGVSLATDLTGNIYAAGQFEGGVVFALDTLIASSTGSFFLVKYDPNGNLLWAKKAIVLDANTWNLGGISIDNSKHIYLVAGGGSHTCKIAFGGDTLSIYDTASIDEASVIFKLDSNGNAICSSIIPAGGAQQPNAIASDASGSYVYLGATALTSVIFGKDTINPFSISPSEGNACPFVARWEECDSNVIYAGIQNANPIGQVVLYPNPNNGSFTLALQNVNAPAQVEIYNMLGESIYKTKLNPTSTVLSLSYQPNGVYFYRVITESGGLVGSGKLVIEK